MKNTIFAFFFTGVRLDESEGVLLLLFDVTVGVREPADDIYGMVITLSS